MNGSLKQYLLSKRFVNATDNYFSGNGLDVEILNNQDAVLHESPMEGFTGSHAEVRGRIEILLDKSNKD